MPLSTTALPWPPPVSCFPDIRCTRPVLWCNFAFSTFFDIQIHDTDLASFCQHRDVAHKSMHRASSKSCNLFSPRSLNIFQFTQWRDFHYFIHEHSVKLRNRGFLLPLLIWNIILNWKWNSFFRRKPYIPQNHDFFVETFNSLPPFRLWFFRQVRFFPNALNSHEIVPRHPLQLCQSVSGSLQRDMTFHNNDIPAWEMIGGK